MKNISIYMAADNNLSDYAVKDIIEMEQIGSSSSLKIMVQVDLYGKENTFRYFIKKSSDHNKIASENVAPPKFEVNTGDPSSLKAFLDWSIDFDSTNNNSIVLWGHGSGWHPPGKDTTTIPSIFSHNDILERLLGYKLDAGHAYGVDFTDAYAALDSLQLKEIFENKFLNHEKLEFIGFDACLMCSLEIIYQLREFTHSFICSVSEEPSEGWPYKETLLSLSHATLNKIIQSVVTNYVKSYLPNGGTQYADRPVTMSAITTNGIASFLAEFEKLLNILIKGLREEKYKYHYIISKAKSDSQTFKLTSYVDIFSFISNIEKLITSSNSDLDIEIKHIIKLVYIEHGKFIYKESLDNEIDNHKLSKHGGMMIYFPPRMYEEDHVLRKAYMLLDFSKDFPLWWDFLNVFYTE